MFKEGFTLLEVIIAVAIAGMAFSAFLILSGKTAETTVLSLKNTLSTIAAHNLLDEAVYMGKSNRDTYILNYKIKVKQDFEELMGYRIVKVQAGTEDNEMMVELYEAR
ncbi:prepilin-type N-terminal cleavage/methylation domain-containing protein [Desulfurobacterium thermolithotrophum]|uniref:type IV pilus modification PilV family protein n=1 Tax=Desulfurobacterium thermolithotrophum TaxID=64160 RepID=UPI0013D64AFE|nr:type II secretion system protein [Desulfurobacterium thermolithotrophum]